MTRTELFCFDAELFFTGHNFWQASLLEQLNGLTAAQALWKPSPERNSIWMLVRHINYWKEYIFAVYYKTEQADRSLNWSEPADTSEDAWQAEIERSKRNHQSYLALVKEMGDAIFDTENIVANNVRQLTHHDAYHTGQIGILRAMQGIPAVE